MPEGRSTMERLKYISHILSLCLSLSICASNMPTSVLASEPPNIESWLATLRTSDEELRLKNAYNISGLVPFSERTVFTLIKALKDDSPIVRMYSASALGEATEDFSVIVPALVGSLSDPEQGVREHATLALAKVGGPAVSALVKTLERMDEGFPTPSTSERRSGVSPGSETDRDGTGRNQNRRTRPNDSKLRPWDVRVSDYAAVALMQIGESAIPEVSEALGSKVPAVRAYAEYILQDISPPPTILTLRKMLESSDKELRAEATSDLADFGLPVLPELDISLRDDDEKVRLAAVKALHRISQEYATTAALPRIFSALHDKSDDVKIRTLQALRDLKARSQDAAPLAALLKSPNARVREQAAQAIGVNAGHDPDSIPALIDALSDPDFNVRESAAEALGMLGDKARQAVPHLILAFKSSDPEEIAYYRGIILESLGKIGGNNPEVIHLLTESLRDFRLRHNALKGFEALGEAAAKDSVPAILNTIQAMAADPTRESNPTPTNEFIDALAAIGDSGLSAFLNLLATTKDQHIRQYGIFALQYQIKSQDARIIPTLLILLRDPRPVTRIMAAGALGDRPPLPEQVVPALAEALKDPEAEVRIKVLGALKKMGKDALPAVSVILKQLSNTDPEIRRHAAQALAVIDTTNDTGIRIIMKELNIRHTAEGFDSHHNPAVPALVEIGRPAVPALAQALKAQDKNVRRNASLILKDIGLQAKDALPALIEALRDRDSEVRLNAARAIGEMKSEARSEETGKALIGLLTDKNNEVRLAAAHALLGIGFELGNAIPTFSTVINDDFIGSLVSDALYHLTNAIRPYRPGTEGGLPSLPPFPWPPPRFSNWSVLPSELLGSNSITLSNVHEKLREALNDLGYDGQGLFEVPGEGFALVTRVERINDDGTSVTGIHRWTRDRIPPASVSDYVSKLFLERPGRFRLFVFAVTTLGDFRHRDESLTEERARSLFNEGGRVLPPALGLALFRGYYVHTLIYVFKKKAGEVAVIQYEDPLGPEKHLKESGIRNKLK
jgi:HEAT repeat protein